MIKANILAMALPVTASLMILAAVPTGAQPINMKTQVRTSAFKQTNRPTYEGYVAELQKAGSSSMTEERLNEIFSKYSEFIMPEVDTKKLMAELSGQQTTYFPLQKLVNEPFYKATIKKLVESSNVFDRLFAYVTLASAGDSTYNDLLLKATKSEKLKGAKMWSGMALLYLKDNRTSDLFDFLVANEDFGDAHMLPFYIKLDKASLKATALAKIKSNNTKARILAVQSLAMTDLTPETDAVVREAVHSWHGENKGYAIFAMKELRMGHLKAILMPFLSDKSLRSISLAALTNSSTPEDQAYVVSLANNANPVPEDVLDALLESKDINMVKAWLSVVKDKKLAPNYSFFINDQPLLSSDALLPDVRDTLSKSTNAEVRHSLPRALEDREDPDSIKLLIALLSDADKTTRYWAAASLKDRVCPELAAVLPSLIADKNLRTVALTDLAIANKVDNLQDVYENILLDKGEDTSDWQRSCADYLAAFPKEKNREYFRSILESRQDFAIKRSAALGLGELRDASSLDLIIASMKEEPPHDLNAMPYLVALSKIKGDRAKEIISSYSNSSSDQVRELAADLLRNW